jgi:RNA polymerase sigma-70 factor (ECF subfamily)
MSDQQTRLEQSLIQAAQRGDVRAFNQLVEAYQNTTYRTAYRILNDAAAADDATQETFISAYRHLKEFRGGSFKAWLLRIVTNACYDLLRAQQRHHTDSVEDLLPDGDDTLRDEPHEFVSPHESLEDHVMRVELNQLLQRAIAALPDDQRIVVVLSDVEGLSYDEIAVTTNTNLGTVKSRLNRGRLRVRDWLLARQELLPTAYRLKVER